MTAKLFFLLGLVCVSMSAVGQSVFTPISGPAGEASWVRDISGDGSTVVGAAVLAGGEERVAFRWRSTTGLETLGGSNSDAHAVSADGSVVVGQADNSSGVIEPFRWTLTSGLTSLGVLDGGEGVALGVSADGGVVVGESGQPPQPVPNCTTIFCDVGDPGSSRAFQWTQAGGIQPFAGFSDYPLSQATGISADGSTVAGNAYTYQSFRGCTVDSLGACRANRFFEEPLRSLSEAPAEVPFGLLPGDVVANLSADGTVLAGREIDGTAFTWSEANGFTGLDRQRYYPTVARDTSASGEVIIGDFGVARSGRVASVKNLLTNAYGLDVLGWQFESASLFAPPEAPVFGGLGLTAISDAASEMAGVARSPSGSIEGFHVLLDSAPTTSDFDSLPPETEESPFSAVLPNVRSGVVGQQLRVFATLLNQAEIDLVGCGIVVGSGVPVDFFYQPTDPDTNDLVGTPDTPVDIAAGASQSFGLGFTPTAEFPATDMQLIFDCSNGRTAAVVQGLNDLALSASTSAEPDVVAVAVTPDGDGVVRLVNQMGEFAVAAINIGPDETLTVSAISLLPPLVSGGPDEITTGICQSDPVTGACLGPFRESVDVDMSTDLAVTFIVIVGIPGGTTLFPNYEVNRLQVIFADSTGAVRGSTSLAVGS